MKKLLLLAGLLLCAPAVHHASAADDATETAAVSVAENVQTDRTATRGQIDAIARRLERDYRISVHTDYRPRAGGNINGEIATDEDLGALLVYLKMFDEEWRKYSPRFIHNTHVAAIVLVKDLALGEQKRSAIPDSTHQILWFDFKGYTTRPGYRNHVIHHEFYHLIEFELHGTAYYKDPQWMAFNDPAFAYGQGGVNAYYDKGKPWATLSHPQPGFIDLYSTLGIEEDKAEIFAALWMKPERDKMMEWAQTDAILRAKIAYFKGRISELDPAIDEKYWSRLDETKLPTAPKALPENAENESQ